MKRLNVLLWCTHCSVLFWCPAGVWDWVGRLTDSADFVLWKVLQQNEAHQRGWREHRSHNGKRTDPGKTALNLFLITAKHDRFFLILEHPRELFFCLLIVSTLGVFLQTVRNTVRFTSGKSAASSLLPCPPCLPHCPYYKRCFFRKNRFWSLDFPVNFNTSSRGYRSCSEPWVLLRQKRKQWKYCAEEHYLPSFPVCWKLIDVLARPWRTGLLSW